MGPQPSENTRTNDIEAAKALDMCVSGMKPMDVMKNSLEFVNIHEPGGKFYEHKPLKRQIFVKFDMYCGLWKVGCQVSY